MRIDHLVINVDKKYQTDMSTISDIKSKGFPYEPSWGKGTSGFKASNLWIGDEYFEMIYILKESGGGWKKDWVEKYNNSHRGLICLFIDTDDIKNEYTRLKNLDINMSEPEFLKFKWFFGLFTRTMPWQNSYLPFFEGAPFQLGFQQMKDEASKDWMVQYMVPNSRDNGIEKIAELKLYGNYTKNDKQIIYKVFPNVIERDKIMTVSLESGQRLNFIKDKSYYVEVLTQCKDEKLKGKKITIHNISVENI